MKILVSGQDEKKKKKAFSMLTQLDFTLGH